MTSRNRYLLKNVGILAISNFSSKLLLFILIPIYTSFLSTNDVGAYDLVISTVGILSTILTCNISSGVMRFFMDNKFSKHEVAAVGFRFLIIGLLLLFLLLLICSLINEVVSNLFIYILLYSFFYTVNQFFIEFAKGLEAILYIAISSFIGSIALLLCSIVFLKYLSLGLNGFFLASIISQALSSFCFIPLLRSHVLFNLKQFVDFYEIIFKKKHIFLKDLFHNSLQHQMLYFSVPLIATSIGWWVNSTAGRYLVSLLLGVSANGILSVAYKIPQIVNFIHSIFIQAWQISAIKEFNSEDRKVYYGRMFLINCFVLNIVGAFTILTITPLCSLFFGADFFDARLYIPYLIISVIINSVAGFLGPILTAEKNTKAMAFSAILGTVSNLFFAFVLIYYIGIQGACLAAVISSLIIYTVRLLASKSSIIVPCYWTVYITWFFLIIEASLYVYSDYYFIEFICVLFICIINYKEFLLVVQKSFKLLLLFFVNKMI